MKVHIKPSASDRFVEFIVTDSVAPVPGWFKIEPGNTRIPIRTSPAHDAFHGRPSDSPVVESLIGAARSYLDHAIDQDRAEHAFEKVLTAWSRAQELESKLIIRNVLTELESLNEP